MERESLKFGYPRPQLQRQKWTCLNGVWDFAIDAKNSLRAPEQVTFDRQIQVPYAPETPASGIADTSFYKACWYRTKFKAPRLKKGERLVVRFGAVDWSATVFINGQLAGSHDGGYTPFAIDVTELLIAGGEQTLVVKAEDDPHDMSKPRGKQDWHLEAHGIWYPRTTGIWQTVWMEVVPASFIEKIRWSCNVEQWSIGLNVTIGGKQTVASLQVTMRHGDRVLIEDSYGVHDGVVKRKIELPDPGIDDGRADLLWRPGRPNLIDVELKLVDPSGKVLDRVTSYTAMRSSSVDSQRFLLNGSPCFLRLVLDQGYWPESGLTAPDDDALRRDVELTLALGFNGVRKHQKIEDPRFLYWADKLGLLVWEEMPSPYSFTAQAIDRLTRTWLEALDRDVSHPCIIAWVPFNESWGVPDLPRQAAQRHFVRGIYSLTKAFDPDRPVIGNDGWENTSATDIMAIHDYDGNPDNLLARYRDSEGNLERLMTGERPGGRVLLLRAEEELFRPNIGKPIMLTEFGGIAFTKEGWGYSRASTAEELAERYEKLLRAVNSLPLISGFCYTQLTDTYQEANGLLYMDRRPKISFAQAHKSTRSQ